MSGLLRSLAPRRLPPAQLLSNLNAQLQERKLDSQYVTMLMSLWDDRTRTLTIANAGSVQPMLVSRRPPSDHEALTDALEVTTLEVEGFPLGLFPIATYDETVLQLAPGDFVIFFSDGILDAENSHGEQFGSDRLSTLLQHHPTATQSAKQMVSAILEAVATHQAGTEHFDDETLIVLHVR